MCTHRDTLRYAPVLFRIALQLPDLGRDALHLAAQRLEALRRLCVKCGAVPCVSVSSIIIEPIKDEQSLPMCASFPPLLNNTYVARTDGSARRGRSLMRPSPQTCCKGAAIRFVSGRAGL